MLMKAFFGHHLKIFKKDGMWFICNRLNFEVVAFSLKEALALAKEKLQK